MPVLLHESISSLDVHSGDTIVDGTFGGGGHTGELLATYGNDIELICVDLDEAAKARFEDKFSKMPNVRFVQSNFKDVENILAVSNKSAVQKVLLDLGTSTFQLLQDTRGFSFQSDTPLAMTFSEHGSHTGFDASTIVNTWQESSIADIIFGYGEERSARKIARAIVEARTIEPIQTSGQLASVIASVIPRRGRSHPATKTFQALRIAVNDELGTIKEALDGWWNVIVPGGRIVVITFHSLEDRIVKHWMRDQTQKTRYHKKTNYTFSRRITN